MPPVARAFIIKRRPFLFWVTPKEWNPGVLTFLLSSYLLLHLTREKTHSISLLDARREKSIGRVHHNFHEFQGSSKRGESWDQKPYQVQDQDRERVEFSLKDGGIGLRLHIGIRSLLSGFISFSDCLSKGKT